MFCPNCGNQMKEGAKFCSNCGWKKNDTKKNIVKMRNLLIMLPIGAIIILVLCLLIKNKMFHSINKDIYTSTKLVTEYTADTFVDQMDTVKFGSYPQSDANGNKKEPIEWIVLDRQENKSLLLSKYILDCKCYHDIEYPVTWETCTLRHWLNNDFLQQAFNYNEQQGIILTEVLNLGHINEMYNTNSGNNTNDKIFCLSMDEVKKYFGNGAQEKFGYQLGKNVVAKGTNYAKQLNNYGAKLKVSKSDWYAGNSYFWLRSTGNNYTYSAFIGSSGYLDLLGLPVNYPEVGVRVALWVANSSISKPSKTKHKNGWNGEYYYENGTMIVNDWKEYNGKWYYLKEDGKYVRNDWKKIGDDYYYFDNDGAMKENAWIDNEYYVGSDGKMLKNAITPDGYYVGDDGKYVDLNKKLSDEVELNFDGMDEIIKNESQNNGLDPELVKIYNSKNQFFKGQAKFDKDGKLWVYDSSSQSGGGMGSISYIIYTTKDKYDTYKNTFVMVGRAGEDEHNEYYKNNSKISATEYSRIEKTFNEMQDMYGTFSNMK